VLTLTSKAFFLVVYRKYAPAAFVKYGHAFPSLCWLLQDFEKAKRLAYFVLLSITVTNLFYFLPLDEHQLCEVQYCYRLWPPSPLPDS